MRLPTCYDTTLAHWHSRSYLWSLPEAWCSHYFASGCRRRSRRWRFGQGWAAAGGWLQLSGRLREVADRVIEGLVPGHVAGHGRNVEVVRGHGGDFAVAAHVNGTRVPMVLDTGASSVVLTQEAAKAAGLPIEVLNYTVNIDTANGRTHAAAVTLDRLAVGGLTERSVPALVAQPGQLKNNLLGMSFLNRLQSWEVRGDRLRLRGTPERRRLNILTANPSATRIRKIPRVL